MTARALALLVAALLASRSYAQEPPPSQPAPAFAVTSLTLFAGTSEGLWRSQDWGRTWELVRGKSSGVPLERLGAARAILPLGPQVFVAGTGGFFLSSDFGETWQQRGPVVDASALLISRYPQSDPTVFLGTATGLQKSADAGQTYRPTGLGETPVYRLEWPGPALVAATGAGVRISHDGGATFSGGSLPTEGKGVRAVALSSFYAIDPVLFAAAESGGVFRSGDGALTWTPAGLSGERVQDLVWLGPFLYAAGEQGFYRSEDAGKNWTRLSDSPGRPSRLIFPLAPAAGLEAFLSTDRGVFRTADAGAHWHPSGLEGKDVLLVATFPPPEPMTTKGKKPRR